jgi:hypothetical protein
MWPVDASSAGSRTSIRIVWGGGWERSVERVVKVYFLRGWGVAAEGEVEEDCWVEPVGVWVVLVGVLVEDWEGEGGAVFSFRRRQALLRLRMGGCVWRVGLREKALGRGCAGEDLLAARRWETNLELEVLVAMLLGFV